MGITGLDVLKPGDIPKTTTQPTGAWIVYAYNVGAYPIFLTDDELKAHRFVSQNGYGYVKFWEFGTEWSDR